MKTELKTKAREMRQDGQSMTKISKDLSVAKSTISLWVKDIKLTGDQQKILKNNQKESLLNSRNLGKGISEFCRTKRMKWQEEGREIARSGNKDLLALCMLYWGEGSKTMRASLSFVNADALMISFFLKCFQSCFNIDSSSFKARIECHLEYDLTYDQVKSYWSELTRIPASNFYTPVIHEGKKQTKGKHRKLRYGTFTLRLGNVEIVQKIYGALQEFASITKSEWLG